MRTLLTFIFILLFSVSVCFPVMAQGAPFTVAGTLTIADSEAISGDIMSLGDQTETLVRSKEAFDRKMYGVLISDPIAVYRTVDAIPVIRNGTARVNVTTLGGNIVIGDLITSSEIAGKGKRGNDGTGYMLGVAVEAYDGSSGTPITAPDGKSYQMSTIKVAIGIGPASPIQIRATGGFTGMMQQVTQAVLFNLSQTKNTDKLIRYLLAIIIIAITVWIAFRAFGKNVTKGIEAIGRNPLAKATIQSVIVMNIVLIAFVVIIGVVVAMVIISL